MLTQWPPRDPKCKLNVSFLTFPHPLDCLICAKYIIIIVLLPEMMRGWDGWWWFIYVWVWVEDGVGVMFFFIFCSVFVLLFIVLLWLAHDCCCVCFIVLLLLCLLSL